MALFVMFDDETEQLCEEVGVDIALPPYALRTRLDSKIETTRLGNEAGRRLGSEHHGAGDQLRRADARWPRAPGSASDLVVQTPYGDSGRTTFFIKSEADWDRYAPKMRNEPLKVMKRINHLPGTIEGCATRHGTLVGPVMTDITGFEEITPYKGGWCGNDMAPDILPDGVPDKVREMARKFGDRLYGEGYKGVFCLDFLLDTDTNEVYLGELNPRISGASPPTNLITTTYGGCPLFLFHLLEYLDVDWELDLEAVQARWTDYDNWTQLVLKQTEDKVELITRAPRSGIWKMAPDGSVQLPAARRSTSPASATRARRSTSGLRRGRILLPRRRSRHPDDPRPDAERRPASCSSGRSCGTPASRRQFASVPPAPEVAPGAAAGLHRRQVVLRPRSATGIRCLQIVRIRLLRVRRHTGRGAREVNGARAVPNGPCPPREVVVQFGG